MNQEFMQPWNLWVSIHKPYLKFTGGEPLLDKLLTKPYSIIAESQELSYDKA